MTTGGVLLYHNYFVSICKIEKKIKNKTNRLVFLGFFKAL